MDHVTALNVNNYKIGGSTIFSAAIFDGDAKTVKLTVIPGTITISGLRQVTISGAKDKANNTMTSYSANMNIVENVKPYVASAKLTANNTIEITMSEAVTGISAGTDFELYIAGVKATIKTYSYADADKVATITFEPVIDDLTKTLQVKLVNGDILDTNSNKAVTGTLVTVTH
jgi:hypothetical protein